MEDACMEMMGFMMDHQEMAQGYAMIATKYKMLGDTAMANFYSELSEHEMAAGNKLHAHLMKKANDPAAAADGRKFYVWGHERAAKKSAEIKTILDDMKRS